MNLELWSCDPASIKPWTDEEKEAFTSALARAFGWPIPVSTPTEKPADGDESVSVATGIEK